MERNSNVNLPEFTSAEHLAERFSKFFIMNKMISDTPNNPCNIFMDADIVFNWKMLEVFQPLSEVEVEELITISLNKSYDLDSFPTWRLNKYVDELLPLISTIING